MKANKNSLGLRFDLLNLTVLFTLGLLGLFLFSSSQAAAKEKCKSCTKTSLAAFSASTHEAKDDFLIATGKCYNLSDPEEQRECIKEAREELLSTREERKEQLSARLEICKELGESPYDPQLDPEDFVDPDDIGGSVEANIYFPLVAGTEWVYEGETEDGTETITVTVTDETKKIEYPSESGLVFTCRVVRDVVELDGDIIEDTDDWYAQDTDGNVWYFGEISKEFEDGELVGLEGSWKAGVDGAKPGYQMFAQPEEGDYYRQEFFLGDAEDMAEVISIDAGLVNVFFGNYSDDVLQTKEWTPIEPDVVEHKYYAPYIGMILEVNPDSGERVELIEMTTP